MHRCHRELHVKQEVIQAVNLLSTVCKDNSTNAMHFVEKLKEEITLLMSFSLDNDLLDVLSSATRTTNAEANMRRSEMLLGQVASRLGECGRKETILDVALVLV